MNQEMRTAWGALRLAFFLGPFLAGLDKFFHLLTNWDMYLSPIARNMLGNLSHPFMLLAGVIEMIVGLMIITRWTRIGGYIASLWLLLIAINLVTTVNTSTLRCATLVWLLARSVSPSSQRPWQFEALAQNGREWRLSPLWLAHYGALSSFLPATRGAS